jgi:3-oxoacyl-[acyl-carrier protein] reductase
MTDASTTGQTLAGEVAIVTGAGIKTGSVIARTLAAEGAAVVVNYRNAAAGARQTVEDIKAAGGRAIAVQCDVTIREDVHRLVSTTVDAFGGPSILVNNANIRSFRPLLELTVEEWRATLGPTLDGTFFCTQAVAPHMQARGAGTIVNIGGASGHSARANRTHVSAAKAGLAGMTIALARELAPHGITVNNIVPGKIDTGSLGSSGLPVRRDAIPTGRGATPQEIANLVLFLCGTGCRQMTGQMLHVNGGTFMTIA